MQNQSYALVAYVSVVQQWELVLVYCTAKQSKSQDMNATQRQMLNIKGSTMKRITTINIDTKSRLIRVANDWDESKHKRDGDGKFTSGGGAGKSASDKYDGHKKTLYDDKVIDGVHWNHKWTPGDSPSRKTDGQLEKDFGFYKHMYETAAKYDSRGLNEIKDKLLDVYDELMRRKNGAGNDKKQ